MENKSCNRFKFNFLEAAAEEGYFIHEVEKDEEKKEIGKESHKLAEKELAEIYNSNIINARDISEEKFHILIEKQDNQEISEKEGFSLERSKIKRFYGEVTEEIIDEDSSGAGRKAGRRFDLVAADPEGIKTLDRVVFQDSSRKRHEIKGNAILNHMARIILEKRGVTFNEYGEAEYSGLEVNNDQIRNDTDFMKYIVDHKEAFEVTFEAQLPVAKFLVNPMPYLNMALKTIGVTFYQSSRPKKGPRGYKIDEKKLDRMNELRWKHNDSKAILLGYLDSGKYRIFHREVSDYITSLRKNEPIETTQEVSWRTEVRLRYRTSHFKNKLGLNSKRKA